MVDRSRYGWFYQYSVEGTVMVRPFPAYYTDKKGGTSEAVRENPTPTVISGVDAPKLTHPTKS